MRNEGGNERGEPEGQDAPTIRLDDSMAATVLRALERYKTESDTRDDLEPSPPSGHSHSETPSATLRGAVHRPTPKRVRNAADEDGFDDVIQRAVGLQRAVPNAPPHLPWAARRWLSSHPGPPGPLTAHPAASPTDPARPVATDAADMPAEMVRVPHTLDIPVRDTVPVASFPSPTRRLVLLGTLLGLFIAAGYSAWELLAPERPAITATGFVSTRESTETLLFPVDGILKETLVEEGDPVRSGEALMRLSAAADTPSPDELKTQLQALRVRQARLTSERLGAEAMDLPPDLLTLADAPATRHIVDGERRFFDKRRIVFAAQTRPFDAQKAIQDRRIEELERETGTARNALVSVRRRLQTTQTSIARGVVYDNGDYLADLYKELKTRESGLQEKIRDYRNDLERVQAQFDKASTRLEQLKQEQDTLVARELADTEAEIATLRLRMTHPTTTAESVVIRAPFDGRVSRLHPIRRNGRVESGQPALALNRPTEPLHIRARLPDPEGRGVQVGSRASILFTAPPRVSGYRLDGMVTGISGDRTAVDDPAPAPLWADIHCDTSRLGRAGAALFVPRSQAEVTFLENDRTVRADQKEGRRADSNNRRQGDPR